MIKKTITYSDLEGNAITEDFYFNLTTAEIAEMELSEKGGLEVYIRRIVAESDNREIIRLFKEIIQTAIGKRSEDGKRLIKNEDIRADFFFSEAWSVLFLELLDAENAAEFIKGIVPQGVGVNKNQDALPTETQVEDDRPAWIRENRDPTKTELQSMTREQMAEAMERKLTRS